MQGRRGWAGGAPLRSELASECRTGFGALQSDTDTAALAFLRKLPEGEREARRQEFMASAILPDTVGEMVLRSIRENAAWIFTHPNLESMVTARHADIAPSFGSWREYREEHGI